MSEWLEVDDITALLASLKDDFQLCQETAFRVLISSKLPPDSFDFSNFVRDTKKELRDGKASLNVSGNYRLRLLCAKFPREIAPLFDEMLAKCERLLDAQSDERLHILRWIQDREDETNSPRGKRTNSGLPPPYAVLSAIEDLLRIHFQLAHTGELSPRSNIQDFALKIRTRLTSVCLEFARIVTPVCHSLSPEGFLPPEVFNTLGVDSDINLLEKMHVNSAQKLLVCCWRTHKCVSTLFALLISNASHSDYLDASMLCKIGDYLWLQLTECRHCGAFECAAQAFDTFCRHLWKCEFAHVSLVHWLNKSMDAISGKNDTDKLCSTRRSAGLPHLMSVILTTAKVGKQFPHLDAVVSKLLACRSLKPAFEIHCVNVLRALFANSALSEAMLTYAETAFGVSFSGCGATNWPVRNAHCQLFAALMERVFGIPKSAQRTLHVQNACKMTSFNFFTRHSSLYSRILDIFNDLLANPRHRSQFNLFPILILLTHLHPSAVNLEAKFPLRRFTPGLLALIGSSPVQKLRELAAAALISTTFEEEIVKILRIFCAQIDTPFRRISNNFFDGLLHIINFMTELHLTISSASSYIVCSVLQRLFDAFTGNYHCANGIDYTLNSTLVNIQRVGSDSLKRYVIERMLTAFDRLDFGAWHCVCRPMGALIAEFYREFWSHVTTSNSNHWPLRLKETLDEIRYEAFRAFIFYDLPIIDFDSDPTTNRILVDLVDDLGDCKVERYLEFIIKLLLRHRDDIKHFPFVCEAIQHAEKNCLCPNNRLNLIRLKYWFRKNSDEASFDKSEMIKIIGNILTSSDDEYTRMAAFNVAIEILESMPLLTNLLEEICIALKDESGEIRNHASTCLMRYFFNPSDSKFVGASLNAELCWSFALERFPNLTTRLLHKREDQSVKNSDIFDASPANIYAEDFGVFEFDEIKKYLNA